MESSEDDAGTATSAPRRASAREKDTGLAEKGNATSSSSLEASEARASCQTPAMSEENFDGDSVPSPSSHDANTSTEAILDMIDEIVDGPGAPKRLPHSLDAASESVPISDGLEELELLQTVSTEDNTPQLPQQSFASSAKSDQEPPASASESHTESGSRCNTDTLASDVATLEESSSQSSLPVAEVETVAESTITDYSAKSGDIPAPNIPTSSVAETAPVTSNVSACETQDRTVKCVTSSDGRDNVTVGSAESTSSDSSVCDGQVQVQEAATRSPLRRRLVRPAPSDRRPDSTVSSTSTSDELLKEQSVSENITKDVSSSSDAVPTVYGNVKPEEIRNVSEISVCKAETSVSPPKKIKLIRQKSLPAVHKDNVQGKPVSLPEQEQCQSTSAESTEPVVNEPCPQMIASTSTSLQEGQSNTDHNKEDMNEISIEIPINECRSEDKEKIEEDSSAGQGALMLVSQTEDVNEASTVQPLIPTKLDSFGPKQPIPEVTTVAETTPSGSQQLETVKQVPKLTIKLSSKQSEEMKSPVPKLTIKPIKPPVEDTATENSEQMPSVSKLNIKPIPKPTQINDISTRSSSNKTDNRADCEEQIPFVTKINIKPIPKPPEKINDIHRKSSSSEISESEYSENDDTSTSDQASASDQGPTDVVPKVTIKLGKPGTQSEGKFYTEKNVPKLTIKSLHNEKDDTERNIPKLTIKNVHQNEKEDSEKVIPKLTIKGIQHCENQDSDKSKLKLVISQPEDMQSEKIPKLTIKTVTKSESQPLSPKLTIKPIKPPDNICKDSPEYSDVQAIPKLKISAESISSISEAKENAHVPKITIKPILRTDVESKTPKKSTVVCDSPEHIPVVTKLNIKPILKPTESGESSESMEDKVPVVSKLNIKPLVKPKDNEVDSSVEDIPKVTKLNIKPIKCPEETSSKEKDCDELNADEDNSIPVVTKLNIKPIVKPVEEDTNKDSENQSSETGNSSDDNADHIPVVTKLNIKPIVKPDDLEDVSKQKPSSDNAAIPIVTKLNIKPLVKPDENISPLSPKRDSLKGSDLKNSTKPVVTKLNIKPVVKPEDVTHQKSKDESEEKSAKNPPLVMKINMKAMADASSSESICLDKKVNNIDDNREHIFNNISEEASKISKPNLKLTLKSSGNDELERISSDNSKLDRVSHKTEDIELVTKDADLRDSNLETKKQNCVPEIVEKVNSDQSDTHEEQPSCSMTKSSDNINKRITDSYLYQEKTQVSQVSNSMSVQELDTFRCEKVGTSNNLKDNESNQISENLSLTGEPPVDLVPSSDASAIRNLSKQQMTSVQNCTLLKKLLQTSDVSLDKRVGEPEIDGNRSPSPSLLSVETVNCLQGEPEQSNTDKLHSGVIHDNINVQSQSPEKTSDSKVSTATIKVCSIQDMYKEASENLKNPLEINISEKVNQSSGQDSPRIILKINKTDQGASAKIIEEPCRPDTPQQQKCLSENTQEIVNDKQSPKRNLINSRRKQDSPMTQSAPMGKRLRSSRIVENADKTPVVRRNAGKRPPPTDSSPPQSKESELSVLETKRLKLGQLLSSKSLTITPVKMSPESPTNKSVDSKQDNKGKTINHTLLNNENCSKNGNSKFHNILSNLQANQIQVKSVNDMNCTEKNETATLEVDSNVSSGSADCEIVSNCHPEVQEMIINENFEFANFGIVGDDVSQDPLEVDSPKIGVEMNSGEADVPKAVESTPQPKKRGRPRKIPLSEPAVVALPIPALEERPQRSLRLSRERPAIIAKPRGGRGRGRGARRGEAHSVARSPAPSPPDPPPAERSPEPDPAPIDPTSSRIKLPRMTEALDKMPSVCSTPLSSRRRSDASDLKLFGDTQVVLENTLPKCEDSFMKSPESSGGRGGRGTRGRGVRGARAARGAARRGGRGRGGGRGAMYMKETLGIYGRVCGPATTTVQLFEEETCMMDDNATPAKPSCLLDEDSQSSVKSSTNESSKMKKSKFADLFDSNKVWTAADVKEYTWPPPGEGEEEPQVMMIQEQVAMFLGVKSFKRRYPELKRRGVGGAERDHVLAAGLVSEALCDLGITAVDASEVLDIMLSDYPHKYEEYRSYQRQKQLAEEEVVKEERVDKVEMKIEAKPAESKPEPPKVDPEKTRQDLALAAIASASEWNSRLNAWRRPACVDLQSLTVQRRRAPAPPAPAPSVRPAAGFYPHALLPGQYQHSYRLYTPDQLRYFPLNTALAAPPAPPPDSSSESEPEWERQDSSADSDAPTHHLHKRKRLTKVKRSSHTEASSKDIKEESRDGGEVDLCKVCKLRLEANRKYTHERFLVCADCNAKLHPGCVELPADTVRRCRDYGWQCAACKTCAACRRPPLAARMLFCDLCDRGFHGHCVGLDKVPSGRWHCVECAICKSCGARDPAGPAASGTPGTPGTPGGATGSTPGTPAPAPPEWHHHTKRGPGGHKMYSHSLCTPCARAYRIGRYCPLCERSFIGPKGTMQLVICKLCDRQLHQECVRATVPALRVLDYTCGECRRGGITSRAAAVRLAPRTIATLFMAKRRFNKYAHRQYLQSRLLAKGAPGDASDDNSGEPEADSRDAEADSREAGPDSREAEPDSREAEADSREAEADSRGPDAGAPLSLDFDR